MKNIDPDINREEYAFSKSGTKKHNALFDANQIRSCYNRVIKSPRDMNSKD
jgi:hypothetical protein